ncbi:MAG: 5'-nucleotidase [Bacteroidia bacterium]|nr:MAG: 5'-nucleotidase [Bacteroidia bacterium]
MKTFLQRFGLFAAVVLILGLAGGPVVPSSLNEHGVMSVLWYQTSAEMRAISYQTFQFARFLIDEYDAKNAKSARGRAVVVDVDETVLNNSPHSAKMILEEKTFPYAWTDWVNRAEAEALPGSVEFLNYAVSKGYDVFYVTNRQAPEEYAGTARNLKLRGFPQADSAHILLKTVESSKKARRDSIRKTHDIVLLIGDNLNDHASVFEKKSINERMEEVDRLRAEFGTRYLVLPNPMYGEWEGAVYGYRWGASAEEKDHMRKHALKSF